MIDERVLERNPQVLNERARERYFEDGILTLPGYVGAGWLDRLRRVVAEKIEESRLLSARAPSRVRWWRCPVRIAGRCSSSSMMLVAGPERFRRVTLARCPPIALSRFAGRPARSC